MTSEQRDPREAWDDDLKAAWSVVEEAAEGSPLYNGTVYCAMKELRSRLNAADPLRAILPEVVEALEQAETSLTAVGVHSVQHEMGMDARQVAPELRALLTRLRALTATEGGTDDGE